MVMNRLFGQQSVCAIDITDSGVFAVKTKAAEDGIVVERALEYKLDFMPSQLHAINQGHHVAKILKDIRSQLGCTRAYCGVPSRHFFYQCVVLPLGKKELTRSSVESHLENHLREKMSLPASHLLCEYEVVEATEGQTKIAVSVVPKNIQASYRTLFSGAGIYPVSLGSSLRSLVQVCGSQSEPMMALYVEPHAIQVKTVHGDHVHESSRFARPQIAEPLLVQQLVGHMAEQWMDRPYQQTGTVKTVLLAGSPSLVKPAHERLLRNLPYQTRRAADVVAPYLSDSNPPQIHRDQLDHFAGAISLAVQGL